MSEDIKNLGKLSGHGTITRKDGTVEPIVIEQILTRKESEVFEASLQRNQLNSQNKTKNQE
jgi:hypothetical protein